MNKNEQFEHACRHGDLVIVRAMLNEGFDPNDLNDETSSYLQIVVGCGYYDLTSLLLRFGANPDEKALDAGEKAQDTRIFNELMNYHGTEQKSPPWPAGELIGELHRAMFRKRPRVLRGISHNIPNDKITMQSWSVGLTWQEAQSTEFMDNFLEILSICPIKHRNNTAYDSFQPGKSKDVLVAEWRKTEWASLEGPIIGDLYDSSFEIYSRNIDAILSLYRLPAYRIEEFLGQGIMQYRGTLIGWADADETPFEPNGHVNYRIFDRMKEVATRYYAHQQAE